jgi:hypothetical protein
VPPRSPPRPPALVPRHLHRTARGGPVAPHHRGLPAVGRPPCSTSAAAISPVGEAYRSKRGSPAPPSSRAGPLLSIPPCPPLASTASNQIPSAPPSSPPSSSSTTTAPAPPRPATEGQIGDARTACQTELGEAAIFSSLARVRL